VNDCLEFVEGVFGLKFEVKGRVVFECSFERVYMIYRRYAAIYFRCERERYTFI
jgi:hypothetical protein